MTEKPSSKSMEFMELVAEQYREALRQMDLLTRREELALRIMDDLNKTEKEIPDNVKQNAHYEMRFRFDMAKHITMDTLFAPLSSAMDKRDEKTGARLVCPDCNGEGIVTICPTCKSSGRLNNNEKCPDCNGFGGRRCTSCGGVGRILDHQFSLNYKLLFAVNNMSWGLHQLLAPQSPGVPGVDLSEGLPEMLIRQMEPAFKEMLNNGVTTDTEAKQALFDMVQASGMSNMTGMPIDKLTMMFFDEYVKYCETNDVKIVTSEDKPVSEDGDGKDSEPGPETSSGDDNDDGEEETSD